MRKKITENKGEGGDAEMLFSCERSEKRKGKGKNKHGLKSKTKRNYFFYHKEGHFRKDCPNRKKKNWKHKESNDIAIVADGYGSSDVLAVTEDSCSDEWNLDSGCSFHMTPNQEWFDSYKKVDVGKV